jgi:hypothetical protein
MRKSNMPSFFLLRLVLVLACLPPIIIGIVATISGQQVAKIARFLSQAAVTMSPEFNYLLKPLGLYVAMFGCLMAYTIFDPIKNRAIITWGAILLFFRGVQRLSLTKELHKLFDIPIALNILHSLYLFLVALIIWLLRPKKEASRKS